MKALTKKRKEEAEELLDALADMVGQFAYEGKGGLPYTGGLSALEHAMPLLVKHGRMEDTKGKSAGLLYKWKGASRGSK